MTSKLPTLTDLALETRTITEQGGACPYQATGAILGRSFYFRYRNGHASLDVGESSSSSIAYGDPYDGSLDGDEFELIFRLLLKQYLKSLSF